MPELGWAETEAESEASIETFFNGKFCLSFICSKLLHKLSGVA